MMKRLTIVRFLLTVVSFLYFALGCTRVDLPDSTHESGIETTPTLTPTYVVPATSNPDPLDGTRWQLRAFQNTEIPPSLPEQPLFIVQFQEGELLLQGGCNSIGGHYMLENESITITFAKRTEMDCSYLGPHVNEIEETFSTAMLTFDSYTLEGKQLRISYIDGEVLLCRIPD